MDIQEFVKRTTAARREQRMQDSDQLTLGMMLEKLKPIVEKQKERKDEATVRYDFDYLFPKECYSWRGSYEELALDFNDDGDALTVTRFYEMLKNVLGKELTGYKGGEFTMHENTPVWVARHNHSGNTAVIEIVDNEYEVIIMTGYREF